MIFIVIIIYESNLKALVNLFHFLHDAFLFLPQVTRGEYVGLFGSIAFYASLWLVVGVGIILVKIFSLNPGVKAECALYRV